MGQDNIKQILLEEIKSAKIAHAYLFSGPRGTGKTTTARLLAKAINCRERDQKSGEPCGQCQSCLEIAGNRSQDLIEIDAASNRRIDEMRELREQVRYVPARDKYRVYIIDEAHMLTAEAFNAFLKTLEEPPAHIVFILATTELAKIPETIFSRCQHLAFTKLPFKDILERLEWLSKQEGVKVAADVLEEVVRKSGGALRDAESLLGQILSIGKKEIMAEDASLFLPKIGFERIFTWLAQLAAKDTASALRVLREIENEGTPGEFWLQQVLELARQILLYKVTSDKSSLEWYFSKDEIARIEELSSRLALPVIRAIVVNLLKASQDMRLAPDWPSLPIELAVVGICEEEQVISNKEKGISKIEQKSEHSNSPIPPARNTSPARLTSVSVSGGRSEAGGQFQNTLNNNHSLEDILAGWGEVLTRVKDKNHALNFILGVGEPVAVDGNTVELGFKYRLQQEKVAEFKNREIIENVLAEVYGAPYQIRASLKEDLPLPKSNEADPDEALVRAALEMFEGAILEAD